MGLTDLVNALVRGLQIRVFALPVGSSWLILQLYVPALWITSVLIFVLLVRHRRMPGASHDAP